MIVDVTDFNFEKEVLEKSGAIPIMVDFWASWCGPCVMLKPILERVVEDYKGDIILAKVNVEDNKKYAGEYGVMSIPAVKFFKDGKVVKEFVGVKDEAEIRKIIDEVIKK